MHDQQNIKIYYNSPVGTELFRAEGRTDITKPIVAFRNSANAPKNSIHTSQRTQFIFIRNTKMFNNVNKLQSLFKSTLQIKKKETYQYILQHNSKFLKVIEDGIYSYHCVLKS